MNTASTADGRRSLTASRRTTRRIALGALGVGGGAPISVQTMTSTDTRDVEATCAQIAAVRALGCDVVRLAVPDRTAAEALREIRRRHPGVPLVADIHFDYRLALLALEAGVDGLRLNPGNIGGSEHIGAVAKRARGQAVPIRIGVNGGSLEPDLLETHGGATPEALVESALRHVALLEAAGHSQLKLSVKASDVPRTVAAYRLLAQRTDHPLHLGLTEAGTLLAGAVRSSAALGLLLAEGIGDTLRVSLAAPPEQEVRVGLELLRCLGLREPGVRVTACPTCGRTQVDVAAAAQAVEEALETWYASRPAAPRPHVAVMGCMVNGPGEARDADLALVGGRNVFDLHRDGVRLSRHPASEAVAALLAEVERWVAARCKTEGGG